jgi:hypothetical protein
MEKRTPHNRLAICILIAPFVIGPAIEILLDIIF